MTPKVKHDPAILFRFALREHDWVLADLLARAARGDARGTKRLARELERSPAARTVPTTFKSLHGLAVLSRELGVDNAGEA